MNPGEKHFGRYPKLLNGYIDRIRRAAAAADMYLPDQEIRDKGVVIIENVLGRDEAERLAEIIRTKPKSSAKREDTLVAAVTMPEFLEWIWSEFIRPRFATRQEEALKEVRKNTFYQHITIRPDDEQSVLHYDTFFPALKFWYFPKSVREGAFGYVEYSPRLTEARLEWTQDQISKIRDNRIEAWRGRGHRGGSLRASQAEIQAMGLKERAVKVGPDTLVIANVFGFHRRMGVDSPVGRLAINGSIRFTDPFKVA